MREAGPKPGHSHSLSRMALMVQILAGIILIYLIIRVCDIVCSTDGWRRMF